jgi:hypothetical protein
MAKREGNSLVNLRYHECTPPFATGVLSSSTSAAGYVPSFITKSIERIELSFLKPPTTIRHYPRPRCPVNTIFSRPGPFLYWMNIGSIWRSVDTEPLSVESFERGIPVRWERGLLTMVVDAASLAGA